MHPELHVDQLIEEGDTVDTLRIWLGAVHTA
jgi:hypothetical protein